MSARAKKATVAPSDPTPGPWSIDGKPEAAGHYKVVDAKGTWVARVHRRNGDGEGGGEALANAHQIAAVPEMVDALNAIDCAFDLDDLSRFTEDQQQAIGMVTFALLLSKGEET